MRPIDCLRSVLALLEEDAVSHDLASKRENEAGHHLTSGLHDALADHARGLATRVEELWRECSERGHR